MVSSATSFAIYEWAWHRAGILPNTTTTSSSSMRRISDLSKRGQDDEPDDALESLRTPSSLFATLSSLKLFRHEAEPSTQPPLDRDKAETARVSVGAQHIPGPNRDRDHSFSSDDSDDEEEQSSSSSSTSSSPNNRQRHQRSNMPVAIEVWEDEDDAVLEEIRNEARQQAFQKVVVAVEDPDAPRRQKRRCITLAVVLSLAVLAIAITLLVPVFTTYYSDGGDGATGSPRDVFDVCSESKGELEVGSSVEGFLDTTLAPPFACEPSELVNASALVEAGHWYQVVGEGSLVETSTCPLLEDTDVNDGMETTICIFQGGCGDDETLVCVETNRKYCGKQSLVSWFADVNETYFVFVSATTTGNYVLSLDYDDR